MYNYGPKSTRSHLGDTVPPPKKSFKKAQFPENIPLQNSPAPTQYQVGQGSYPVIAKYVGTNIRTDYPKNL